MKKSSLTGLWIILTGMICSHIAMAQSSFSKHTISTNLAEPMDVHVGDLNGDGYPDIATVTYNAGEIAWWENDGQAGFSKRLIKIGFIGGRSIRSGDIDGDGDIDLIAAAVTSNRIEWYENSGTGTFTTHLLDNNFRGAHTVQLIDLDQDGDMDILCSGWDNSAAKSEEAWWENNGNEVFTKHVISPTLDQSPFIDAADIDLDGDLDLIGTDETTGEVYGWSNDGHQVFTEYLIDNQFNLAHTALLRDIDKDGDSDILGAACTSGLQAWYENKGSWVFTKHSMENLAGAIWLDMADFDLDGDNDMIAAAMGVNQLALYSNNGQQQFSKSWITGGLTSGFALDIVDMDLDGDPDVVAIGYASSFLGWWENTVDRTALIQSPSWIVPGNDAGNFLIVNSEKGNIVSMGTTEPTHGVVNPRFCRGIALAGNLLYANVGPYLNVYHPVTGMIISSYRSNTQYLEGMTLAPDGKLYLSAPLDGFLICFSPVTTLFTTVAEGLDYPRALRFDPLTGEILILDGEEMVAVKSLNPSNGEISTKEITPIPAGGDIETDGAGNWYISSPESNSIYANTSSWAAPTALYRSDLAGPWGMWYDNSSRELVVCMNTGNSVDRIPATASGIPAQTQQQAPVLTLFPNPCRERMIVNLSGSYSASSALTVISPDGRVMWRRTLSLINSGSQTIEIRDLSGLPEGLYYLVCSGASGLVSVPFIRE